jgi:hypothetical protein
MGGPVFFWIICVFMAFIQVEFWSVFPRKMRDVLVANPIMAFIVEFISSLSISYFTGIGSFVGLANVCSGIFFMIWVMWYRHKEGIKGIKVRSFRVLRIPVMPKLVVCYSKNGVEWEK